MRMLLVSLGLTVGVTVVTAGAVTRSMQPKPRGIELASAAGVVSMQGGPAPGSINVKPGEDDAHITRVVARLLAKRHYLQQELTDDVSSRFLDKYLDAYDPGRIYFLQADVDEFNVWRTKLDEMTWDAGDTTPAYKIFNRFLQRLTQQNDYVTELLKTEKFTFETDEEYALDRKDAPRPKDLDEAKKLWRDRVRYEYLQEKLNKQPHDEIVKRIANRYGRTLNMLRQYDSNEVFQLYLTSLANVFDPHSDYMGRAAFEDFSVKMKLSLFGIGAKLTSEEGYCKIEELTPGGPAIRSGQLKPGDRIIAVAQGGQPPVDVIDMRIDKIVDMIRGPKGAEVRLTIIPADAPDPSVRRVVSLIRDTIKLEEQEAKGQIIDVPATADAPAVRLGVIDLPGFYEGGEGEAHRSATDDVARLLKKLQAEKIQGLILDLRKNGGGSLTESIRLSGLFIKEGPVVQIRDHDGSVTVERDPDPAVHYGGPMIVLTSRHSASASEILAGALQDYGRAVVVGENTSHGKGTVQSLMELAGMMRQLGLKTQGNPGALKLTIRKFYRPSGASTQLKGVVPDIVLPSTNEFREIGESALENPLVWDTIPGAQFRKDDQVSPYVAELKKRSDARIGKDRDFAYVREDVERVKKLYTEKKVSLNEKKRLDEKQQALARAEARKAELKSRAASSLRVHNITLKDVDKPGLPPAVDPTKQTAAAKPRRTQDSEDEALDMTGLERDFYLDEAQRILADLVLLSKDRSTASTR